MIKQKLKIQNAQTQNTSNDVVPGKEVPIGGLDD